MLLSPNASFSDSSSSQAWEKVDSRRKSLAGVEGDTRCEMVQGWQPASGMSYGRVTCLSGGMPGILETRPVPLASPYRPEKVSDSPEEGAARVLEEPEPGSGKGRLVVSDPD